jgi:hypothetical protein
MENTNSTEEALEMALNTVEYYKNELKKRNTEIEKLKEELKNRSANQNMLMDFFRTIGKNANPKFRNEMEKQYINIQRS